MHPLSRLSKSLMTSSLISLIGAPLVFCCCNDFLRAYREFTELLSNSIAMYIEWIVIKGLNRIGAYVAGVGRVSQLFLLLRGHLSPFRRAFPDSGCNCLALAKSI
jgi:hypothetical protein